MVAKLPIRGLLTLSHTTSTSYKSKPKGETRLKKNRNSSSLEPRVVDKHSLHPLPILGNSYTAIALWFRCAPPDRTQQHGRTTAKKGLCPHSNWPNAINIARPFVVVFFTASPNLLGQAMRQAKTLRATIMLKKNENMDTERKQQRQRQQQAPPGPAATRG